MVKDSLAFKLFLLLLALSLSVTLFAVVATKGIKSSTEAETTDTGEAETEAPLDPLVIFSHESANAEFNFASWPDSEQTEDLMRASFYGYQVLEPGKRYELSWKLSPDLVGLIPEISLCIHLSYGDYEEFIDIVCEDDSIWENSFLFEVPGDLEGCDFDFVFGEGTKDEVLVIDQQYLYSIPKYVQFWVREASEGG